MPIDEEVKKIAEIIKNDNVSGARELAERAVKALVVQIDSSTDKRSFLKALEHAFILLIKTRPSMAPIINGLGTILNEVLTYHDKISFGKLKSRARQRAENFILESKSAIKRISEFSSKLIHENDQIMTHSMSRTIFETFQRNVNKNIKLYFTESRPQLEGVLFAKSLSKFFPISLIVDSAMGHVLKTEKIDSIFVGADSILADGSLINKIGTYPLALLARENHVPFHVAAESFKFNIRSYHGQDITIEEKSPNEILPEEVQGVSPRNFYFDVTPAKLITSIISEFGIFTPKQFVKMIPDKIPLDWFKKYLNY